MASVLECLNGTTSLLPGTGWTTPNGLFGTPDRNDGSIYTFSNSNSRVTLPASGLADGYLFLWGVEFEDTSNGRFNPTGRMFQQAGTGTFASASTGGYSRDNSEDRAYVSGWSFVDNPSASAAFQFEWRRDADAPTGGTVRSFLQVIPLYYADVGVYTSSASNTYGGTTPNLVTGFSGTDGTNITLASNQVSVTGDNKRYLVLGSGYLEDVSNGSRTQRWFGLEIDGSFDHAAKGCMYYRNGSNTVGGESFMRLLETVTATRTIELNCYRGDGVGAGQGGADVDDDGTVQNGDHAIVVIELNDSAEVFSSTNDTNVQEFALTGPVDVNIASTAGIEFNDSASFTRVSDTAVNCESAMDVLAFANISHAREASSIGSGSRWTVHGEFTINGTEQTAKGFHGNYNRGNQSSTDAHGSSCNQAGLFAVAANDDIGVSNQELAGTEGGGGDIETQADWVGFGLINLDSLQAAAGNTVEMDTATITVTANDPQAVTTEKNFSELPSASVTMVANDPDAVTTDLNTSEIASATLTLTANAPQAVTTENRFSDLPSASLTLTANPPQADTTELNFIEVPSAALTLTANAPQAVTTELNFIELPSAVLTLTANAPDAVTSELNTSEIASATLTLTANVPQAVTTELNYVEVPATTLTVTANAPQAVTTELNFAELPSATVTLTANAPQAVTTEKNFIELPSAALTLTANAPEAVVTEGETAQLPSAALTLTANDPQAVVTELNTAQLPSASLTLTANVPQAVTTELNTAEIAAATLTLTANVPQAVTTEGEVSELPSAALTMTANAPQAVVPDVNLVEIPAAVLSLTTFAPTIITTGEVPVEPQGGSSDAAKPDLSRVALRRQLEEDQIAVAVVAAVFMEMNDG